MRKEAVYQITDRIAIYYIAEGKVKSVLQSASFAEDVLAVSVTEGSADGFAKEVDINGEKITLILKKI